jgi:DNA/RNA endonuclease YhcR with UshA esterase domain
MTKRTRLLLLLCCIVALVTIIWRCNAGHTLTAAEAKKHVGEKATVCGKVVSTRYAVRSRGQPTFLNLDEPYPRQVFTVVIWGSDRANFGSPEVTYQGKKVCVKGNIEDYRGVPEIVASEAAQIKAQSTGQE